MRELGREVGGRGVLVAVGTRARVDSTVVAHKFQTAAVPLKCREAGNRQSEAPVEIELRRSERIVFRLADIFIVESVLDDDLLLQGKILVGDRFIVAKRRKLIRKKFSIFVHALAPVQERQVIHVSDDAGQRREGIFAQSRLAGPDHQLMIRVLAVLPIENAVAFVPEIDAAETEVAIGKQARVLDIRGAIQNSDRKTDVGHVIGRSQHLIEQAAAPDRGNIHGIADFFDEQSMADIFAFFHRDAVLAVFRFPDDMPADIGRLLDAGAALGYALPQLVRPHLQ